MIKRRKSAGRSAWLVCLALIFVLAFSQAAFCQDAVLAAEVLEDAADVPEADEGSAGEPVEETSGVPEETTEAREEELPLEEASSDEEEVLTEEAPGEEILLENETLPDELVNADAESDALKDEEGTVSLAESSVVRKVGYVAVDGLNIRKGAGTNYTLLGSISNTLVVIRSQKRDSAGTVWYKIYHNGVTGYICSGSGSTKYVTDIRKVTVDTSKVADFPDSYKEVLIDLLAINPNYVFKVNQIDCTLEEAARWHVGKKVDPDYSWSSYSTIYHYMDPLNYMDPQHIFAFAKQTYNSTQNEEGLKKLFSAGNAFLNTASYRKALLEAGKDNGVSPYVLAATILAEKGWHADEDGISAVVGWQVWTGQVTKNSLNVRSGPGTEYEVVDQLDKGNVYIAGSQKDSNGKKWYWVIRDNGYGGYVSSNYVTGVAKYDKFYNFFSINQTDDNSDIGGIVYAMKMGWNTPVKSIKGGAVFYKDGYINNGQDTYYYKDYNVINPQSFWWHEYAGAVHSPYGSALLISYAYTNDTTSKVVFRIPVYKANPSVVTPTDLSLDKSEVLLLPDKNTKLAAQIYPSNATDKNVLWESSNTAVATVDKTGKITAKKPGFAKVTAKAEAKGSVKDTCKVTVLFPDVKSSKKYYYQPVYWALEKGIVSGYSSNKFGIGDSCTRKQMILFLWRSAGRQEVSGTMPFKDIRSAKDTDTYKAILWGVQKGIIKGYKDGTFKPKRNVTRAAAMIMLYRAAGSPKVSGTMRFTDVLKKGYTSKSDTYNATLWAYKKGIAKGYSNGTFGISLACRREHIVTFLYNYYKK